MTDKPKPKPKPAPEILTPSEQASLRQDLNEKSDYLLKAFSHLRPKAPALKPEKAR
jgi:hypothetical protein